MPGDGKQPASASRQEDKGSSRAPAMILAGLAIVPVQENDRYPARPRSAAPHGAMQVRVSGNNVGKTMSLLSRALIRRGWMYHAGGRVPPSPMEGLTPASADDLLPLGELLVDDSFWSYPAWAWLGKGPGICVSGVPGCCH